MEVVFDVVEVVVLVEVGIEFIVEERDFFVVDVVFVL